MAVGDGKIAYALLRSRRRTLAIHIRPDGGVEARAPLRLPVAEIERFIAAKAAWITRKQAQMAARRQAAPRELPPPQYADGEFERVVRELVSEWSRQIAVAAAFVGIRKMSTRWGSCTAKTRRIRINAALAYCPRECLEYVVVHELAHLRENNHSPRFWAIVAGALPDYKARQSKLRASQWILDAMGGREYGA